MTIVSSVSAGMPWWQRSGRALRNPNYRRYFAGQIPLLIGSWIHSIALGWLMWRLSASPWLLGILALCDLGPIFFLGPVTGTIIDRMEARRVLLCTQLCFVMLVGMLAVLTLTGNITIDRIIVMTLALGTVTAFDSPARQALIGELVGPDELRNAIALNSMLFNTARLIGPAIGGTVVALFGEGWCFVIKALTYLPPLYVLITLKLDRFAPKVREGFLTEMARGWAFVRERPEVGRILLLVGICSFTSVPYFSFLPVLAGQMLESNAGVAGLLMSITGVGAVCAAILLAVKDNFADLKIWPLWSAVLLGLVQILIGLSGHLWLTAMLALPMGFAILSQNLASNTLLQHFAPAGFRGRIMALYSMMMLGTVPLGSLGVGALAGWIGMPATFVFGGALCSLTALYVFFSAPRRVAPTGEKISPVPPSTQPTQNEI